MLPELSLAEISPSLCLSLDWERLGSYIAG